MISLLLALVWASPQATRATDTIVVAVTPRPHVDGRVGDDEYGEPAARIETAAGVVPVRIARHDDFIYIAAELPDSTFYWGDDFVVSLDADGSGDVSPQPGDRQWYLRRVLDSSTVVRAVAGSWNVPGQQPAMLGPPPGSPSQRVERSPVLWTALRLSR